MMLMGGGLGFAWVHFFLSFEGNDEEEGLEGE